jgi:hypothetical protein
MITFGNIAIVFTLHVHAISLQGATDVRVTLIDQNVYPAKVVNAEPDKDVAVLELEAPEKVLRDLTPIQLGNSARLQVCIPCHAYVDNLSSSRSILPIIIL